MDAAENTIFYGIQNLMEYDASKIHSWRYFKCDINVLIGKDRNRQNFTITPILLLTKSILFSSKNI
jgi:hypothetical protein